VPLTVQDGDVLHSSAFAVRMTSGSALLRTLRDRAA
jgi:hypothetical protein